MCNNLCTRDGFIPAPVTFHRGALISREFQRMFLFSLISERYSSFTGEEMTTTFMGASYSLNYLTLKTRIRAYVAGIFFISAGNPQLCSISDQNQLCYLGMKYLLHFHFLLSPSWLILFFKTSRNVTSREQLQIISLLYFSKVWWFSGKVLLNHTFFSFWKWYPVILPRDGLLCDVSCGYDLG